MISLETDGGDCTIFKVTGEVTADEILFQLAQYMRGERTSTAIWDFSETQNIKITTLEMKGIADSIGKFSNDDVERRVAMVGSKTINIGLGNDTKNLIERCNVLIDMSYYPENLKKAANKNDNVGTIAKLLLIIEKYNDANNLWIQGINDTKYVDGENIVSSKIYEAKAIFEITLKDLEKIPTKNADLKNVNNKIETALTERIAGSELSATGYYKKRKDYQGEFERGRAKIKIADRYFIEALKELNKLLPKYNTNFTRVALSKVEWNIKYYEDK